MHPPRLQVKKSTAIQVVTVLTAPVSLGLPKRRERRAETNRIGSEALIEREETENKLTETGV